MDTQTPFSPGDVLGLVIFVFFLGSLWRRFKNPPPVTKMPSEPERPATADNPVRAGTATTEVTVEFDLPTGLPAGQRLAARWRRLRARDVIKGEMWLDLAEPNTVNVVFPIARELAQLEFVFTGPTRPDLVSLTFTSPNGESQPVYRGDWRLHAQKTVLLLVFARSDPLTRIRLELKSDEPMQCDCNVKIMPYNEPDVALLMRVNDAVKTQNDVDEYEAATQYDAICPRNPLITTVLAWQYLKRDLPGAARLAALRTIAMRCFELGIRPYEAIIGNRGWGLDEAALTSLRSEAAAWDLPGHHGVVTLQSRREFLIGPGGFECERYHAAILVRRRAAGRWLRSVAVPMVQGPGGLLYTHARIHHDGGRTEDLARDRFTVGSAEDDNPFVTVARRQTGQWILSDLERGDIVEFTYHVLRLERGDHDGYNGFMLAGLVNVGAPTLRCEVVFISPETWDIEYAAVPDDVEREIGADEVPGYRRARFATRCVVPRLGRSDPYDKYLLNPYVAAAARTAGWDAVATRLDGDSIANVVATSAVPGALAAAIGDAATPREVLARAFYWIRDKIKYGALESANARLTSPDRAEAIVTSRIGDCKDVSFLLAVACQQHGIPWEFVLVSTSHGVVVSDLPADQFDHMMVRAQVDGVWLVLDASSGDSVFTAPPSNCEGLTALSHGPDAAAALVTIPESPVTATAIAIRETIDRVEDGWLVSRIEATLDGRAARWLDELWKISSLAALNIDIAAEDAVRTVVPEFLATDVVRLQDTADSDRFVFTATGRRARLIDVGSRLHAVFKIDAAWLPTIARIGRQLGERLVLPFRAQIDYDLEILGEVRRRLIEHSTAADRTGEPIVVTARFEKTAERLHVSRHIEINRRIIDGELLAALPDASGLLEQACRVVVVLHGGD